MKNVFVVVSLIFMSAFNASAATGPWVEVANEVVLADNTTFRDIRLKNNKTEFEEVRVQILTTGARLQRTEIVGDNMMSLPAWRLEGEYTLGVARYDLFQKSKVRSVRMYITTMQPTKPVRLTIHMR